MQLEALNTRMGHPRYAEIINQLRDKQLADEMLRDAGHELEEAPGKVWSVVLYHGDGHPPMIVAWCASMTQIRPGSGGMPALLKCSDNYERRGVGRLVNAYRLAYTLRHVSQVMPLNMPAATYLYEQPIKLHQADGWYLSGPTGVDEENGHRWWQLWRD